MSNSKPALKKTTVDIINELSRKQKREAGLSRQNFTGIAGTAIAAVGGSGALGSDNITQSGQSYLKTVGDTMIGPLAFWRVLKTISSGVLDVSQSTGAYSSYVIVDCEGVGPTDDLVTISGAAHAGQILLMEGIATQTVTIKNSGNIETLDGNDWLLQDDDFILFVYSDIDAKWQQVTTGKQPTGANKSLSNLTNPTNINQTLKADSTGLRDLGTSSVYWRDIFVQRIRLNNLGSLGSSNEPVVAFNNTDGLFLNMPSTKREMVIYDSNAKMLTVSGINARIYPEGTCDLGHGSDSVKRFKRIYMTNSFAGITTNGDFELDSATFHINSGITTIGNSVSDDVVFTAKVSSDFDPDTSGLRDIGNDTLRWRDVFYAGTLDGDNITLTGEIDMTSAFGSDIMLSGTSYIKYGSTVSSASSGTRTLPAQPAGFFYVKDPAGSLKLIPYYNL